MDSLFPSGVSHYVVGGVLIGFGIGLVYLMTGRIAGVSSILTGANSLWSRRRFFRRPEVIEDRNWKSVLILGLLLGALLSSLAAGAFYVTTVQTWRLALGGIFVGFGTRLARGCTSGHGVCGLSAVSKASFAATIGFLGTAIVVAHIVAATGLRP